MASFRGISHCYQRPTYADWPYSVFTMAHGRSKEECDAVLDAIAADTGIDERATLYSSTEFKKIRLLYFTDEFRDWEAAHSVGRHSRGRRYRLRSVGRHAERFPLGRALRARPRVLVGGVNSPVRAMRAIGRDPLFIARGEGAELIDADGNRYIDYVCSWGALVAGHAHPAVVAAVARAAARGTSFGAPTEAEVELAEEVARARCRPSEMVRMTSSGTEAAMTAIRIARAATGRETIVKFAGAYHGHSDGLLAQAGSGLATQGIPASPGVPAATPPRPWSCRGTTPDALAAAIERHAVAAIIAEPCPANMGLVAADRGLPRAAARAARTRSGALLILDEVISGFRVARGGASERSGVTRRPRRARQDPRRRPAGRRGRGAARELLELLAPVGEVYQAGTLSGNPLAVAAGLATLATARRTRPTRRSSAARSGSPPGLRAAAGGRAAGQRRVGCPGC